ncbi:aminoglycoside phosphotransferase family protein [Streptomyces sp. L2]|uniref:aminoglycoside phosphotransferase family protein n=1 Tax=Streptomyces sp. L2 TaxID=2162665 RepID=UPI001011FBA7|nr:aminoglycoside phosphotransferase family protein [Streptomyces sp. L2]
MPYPPPYPVEHLLRRRMHGMVLPGFERISEPSVPRATTDIHEAAALAVAGLGGGSHGSSVVSCTPCVSRGVSAIVETDTGMRLFVKALGPGGFGYENEAVVLGLLGDARKSGVPVPAPELLFWDPVRHVLATTEAGHSASLDVVLRAADARSAATASSLVGGALATVHAARIDVGPLAAEGRVRPFPLDDLADLTPSELSSGVGVDFDEFVACVQSVSAELGRLREERFEPVLVHGDLRAPNILVAENGCATADGATFVDWELAGAGDAAADVGTVLAESLATDLAVHGDIRTAGAWNRIFLAAYQGRSPMDEESVLRSVRHCGTQLIRTTLSRLEHQGTLGRAGRLQLILGSAILRDPARSKGVAW